ncbi:MAG: hypothetical protein ACRD01_02180 [Terriglobales bacterium]
MTTWRGYRPDDEGALRAAHQRQCAAITARGGEGFAFPDLGDLRYLLAEAAEREGELLGAVVAHATVELMLVGGSRAMLHSLAKRGPELRGRLRALGCDEVHAFVPRARLDSMTALLGALGMRRSNPAYVPYYTEL